MTTTSMPQTGLGQPKRRRVRWIDIKEQLTGYLFILPAFVIITAFGFFPIGSASQEDSVSKVFFPDSSHFFSIEIPGTAL